MIIKGISCALDGGTIKIYSSTEIYCIDKRIHSKTIGKIYKDYPLDDNSNIFPEEVQDSLRESIKDAIEDYSGTELNFNWKASILNILK